jgi:hypothetical protein
MTHQPWALPLTSTQIQAQHITKVMLTYLRHYGITTQIRRVKICQVPKVPVFTAVLLDLPQMIEMQFLVQPI